ncbi:MAG: phosphotransferase [Acidimicrobiales bacterium]
MREPGPLIASGRDADIFDYGPGLVLRRSRHPRSIAAEARIMEYVRAQGYPVPAIEEVSSDGLSIVMERIDGIPMVDVLGKRPWTLRRNADVLADLHLRLHRIEGPDWLPVAPGAAGDRLVHFDLHPLNVMVGHDGPIVIDWANARRGHPASDVALTWVLNMSGRIEAGAVMAVLMRLGRTAFANRFMSHFDRTEVSDHLAAIVEWKAQDANMSAVEVDAMRALVRSNG